MAVPRSAGNKKRILTRNSNGIRTSSSNKNNNNKTSSSSSSSSSSIMGTGIKEKLQLTLIGMAICAGIYLFMFSKINTMHEHYNISDLYHLASTSASASTAVTNAITSATAITTMDDGSNTNNVQIITTPNAIDDDYYSYFNIDEEYEIQKKKLQLWREKRNQKEYYIVQNEWFEKKNGKLHKNADSLNITTVSTTVTQNANVSSEEVGVSAAPVAVPVAPNNGPILDFVIAGFPKCGTTGLVNNLMHVAPYGGGDWCTPPDSSVYYAYNNWPNEEKKENPNQDINLKFMRGTKCPRFLETEFISELSRKLPKTRVLVGIRHPVLWFQSFYNMQMSGYGGRKYQNMSIYDELPHVDRKRNSWGCLNSELFCVARSKFYLPLASLGKTSPMSDKEIKLLLSNDYKNDKRTLKTSQYIRNPILLYEQQQPSEQYFWNDVSNYLYINRSSLPEMAEYTSDSQNKTLDEMTSHEKTKSKKRKFDICHKDRDPLRKLLLPISYNIYIWLMEYFIPASKIKKNDIYISNLPKFIELIKTYQYDPCNRLIRNDTDGNFYT